jgi:hypothetical protein
MKAKKNLWDEVGKFTRSMFEIRIFRILNFP